VVTLTDCEAVPNIRMLKRWLQLQETSGVCGNSVVNFIQADAVG
jgi:hypothetical protein